MTSALARPVPWLRVEAGRIRLPALATAHSHVFQRALRGHAQRPGPGGRDEASTVGAQACGFDDAGGEVTIRRDHPALELVEESLLLDAIVFGGDSTVIDGR
jgi:hypothetical protein